MEYIVETRDLCKSFKHHRAVKHLDMKIKKGSIYGFIGRNGAGKSTTLKMICGLSKPSSGEILLFGGERTAFTYRSIGALIEQAGLFPDLSAKENMCLKATGLGLSSFQSVEDLLQLVGLAHTKHKPIKKFSVGMKQRLGIAMALLGNPDLLILDEPLNGLDPEGIKEMRDILLNLNQHHGITMIISSHMLGELEKIATCYGMIKDGELIEQISADELKEVCKSYLAIQVNDIAAACALLENELHINDYKVQEQQKIWIFEEQKSEEINSCFLQHGIIISQMYYQRQDLETYFLHKIGGEQNA